MHVGHGYVNSASFLSWLIVPFVLLLVSLTRLVIVRSECDKEQFYTVLISC